jgi:hypothetical protein
VGAALGHTGHHGQDRLFAIKRLDLRLFIDTEHERAVGRRQIEADDVANLVDEQWVAGQLERLRAVWLQPEGGPDAPDRGMGKACRAAMERIDQWVASAGIDRKVRSMIAAT